jgi:hypothetical protein
MKTDTSIRTYLLVAIFVVSLIALALPSGVFAEAPQAKRPYVALTVNNNSQFDFTLWLLGPERYNITVPPESKETIIVDRGWYSFTMTACNVTEVGTMDLNIYQIIQVPVCGGRALRYDKPHEIDTSEFIKPIKITIRNKTYEAIDLYLRTIDNDYFIHFEPMETKTQIVLRSEDEYVYSFVACDALQSGYYTARVTPPLDLDCANK